MCTIGGDTTINGNTSITGNAFFQGDILSGPLELNSRNPSSQGDVKVYNQGTSTAQFLSDVGGFSTQIVPCNGSYGNMGFSYYSMKYTIQDHFYLFLYDKDLNNLGDNIYGSAALYENGYVSFDEKLQIGFYNPNAKTFKLNNLPSNEPNQQGAVWADASGYLRLTTLQKLRVVIPVPYYNMI